MGQALQPPPMSRSRGLTLLFAGAAPAYMQTADSLSFRKLSAAAAAEVNEAARRRIAAGDAPTASAQVTSAVIGATCYAAQVQRALLLRRGPCLNEDV